VNIGSRDNARPGDLMGAIANQAGLNSAEVGKIDVRESHSIVEVAAGVADTVIERVTGTSIRGRRAIVRRDEERPPRGPGGGRSAGSGRGARGPVRGARREARE
jgi:ATP-dependent RNA helicase DeaD